MGSFGLTEIIILFLIIVFLFGAKRIPDLFRAVGSSIKNLKKELNPEEESKQNDNTAK
jgi:sec-independent protein translocase protein TatA